MNKTLTMKTPGPLQGRHALVTGASRGIGAEIARTLATDGARITLLGRQLAALQAVAQELPGDVKLVVADVADAAAVQKAFTAAENAHGPVTLLINNAGQAGSAPLLKTTPELWQQMLDVNLSGSFHCIQAGLPQMLAAGWGRIVNIASTAGLTGYPYVTAYAAAKHGVIGLTRSLARELASQSITVNAVCPGYTETDIVRESIANVMRKTGRSEAEAREHFTASNPQGSLVQPQQVADAVRWLCGDAAAAVTGQAISVSGGEVM